MRLRVGNLIPHMNECDLLLFTANSELTKDGRLIMGAGFAKQVKLKYPGLDAELGSRIESGNRYGVLLSETLPVGAFQTKRFWADKSTLGLIEYSVAWLIWYIDLASNHGAPRPTIYLNYPGIGHGQLEYSKVKPIVERLPDNVVVWRQNSFN